MVLLLVLLSLEPGVMVDGLEGGTLHWRDTGNGGTEIALGINEEIVSNWVSYPLTFNPAKLFCEYSPENGTLEVNSQLPYTADYTFAWYIVDDSYQLSLHDEGEGDYYGGMRHRIEELLEQGYMEEAVSMTYDIMYPHALPDPEEFCAMFVIEAAKNPCPETFALASEVANHLLFCQIDQIEYDSDEFHEALRTYNRFTERNQYDE